MTGARLRGIELFAGLDDERRDWLAAAGTRQVLRDGEMLFDDGQPAEHFYVLLAGELLLSKRIDGREQIVGRHFADPAAAPHAADKPPAAHQYTGELPLLAGGGYVAAATAVGPVELLVYDRETFLRMLVRCPEICRVLLPVLVWRIRSYEAQAGRRTMMEGLGTLAAGLAHELNNPVAALVRAAAEFDRTAADLITTATAWGAMALPGERAALDGLVGLAVAEPAAGSGATASTGERGGSSRPADPADEFPAPASPAAVTMAPGGERGGAGRMAGSAVAEPASGGERAGPGWLAGPAVAEAAVIAPAGERAGRPAGSAVAEVAAGATASAGELGVSGRLVGRPAGPATATTLASERATLDHPPTTPPEPDPLAAAEAVDAMSDWLAAAGIPDAADLAPALSSITPADLAAFAAAVRPEVLDIAVRLLAGRLSARALAVDAQAAGRAISALVASAAAYSDLGRAPDREVDVLEGLEATLRVLAPTLTGLTIVRDYAPLPPVIAHLGELNQVWTHLVRNAAEAMGGHGELRLTTRREGPCAVVEVRDSGPGIPPDLLPRLFQPFFTTKDIGHGTGLGLHLCHEIVAIRHNGSIEAVSAPGDTRFVVRLPGAVSP
ncbi:ATP-binding protein [Amycolatopsis sp. NPDC049688]|uniref:ATP-binding protein n=1 Tax=Amycolatopsis sp. NPDC049688 TaxID=3154733 RepID=UPI0034393482